MASQTERDAQGVICQVVDIALQLRELRPLIRHNPKALEVSARMESRAKQALKLACILYFPGDSLGDLDSPPAA